MSLIYFCFLLVVYNFGKEENIGRIQFIEGTVDVSLIPNISKIQIHLTQQDKMSFYRSDQMECYRLVMPRESAWETINTLGKHGLVHIVPNKSLQAPRIYTPQVKMCDEGLLNIKSIERFLIDHNMGYPRQFMSKEQYAQLVTMWEVHESSNGVHKSRFGEVDEGINHIWKYQQELMSRKATLKQKLLLYRENIAIVLAGKKEYGDSFYEIKSKIYENQQHTSLFGLHDLEVKAIVVQDEKSLVQVKRVLNRISKGISFINDVSYKELFDELYPGEQHKSVLFIIYPAKKGSILDKKVVKILDNYCPHWSSYTLPQTDSNFVEKNQKLQALYAQTTKMFQMTKQEDKTFLKSLLGKVQGSNITQLQYYKFYIMKQRQIYSQLNEMNTHLNFVEGEVFLRSHDVQQVKQLLYKISSQSKTPIATLNKQKIDSKLPTHFQINDFKRPAQQITDTYGVPRYQEANPSFFTLITFPFLFGVMFGDIAHGFIAFLFGVFLIYQSENSSSSVIRMLFPYRYLITLMGFFATYCGFIYNDFLSISLNLFGSCFNLGVAHEGGPIHKTSSECVYPFGVDPAWTMANNYLNYINSLKMKISVIIAVIHMTLGVFVKASNALYFRHKLDFFFEFIPQLIFLVGLFGYMDFLIIYKWLKPWKLYDSNAPSIITTMINLPLKMGKTDKCCGGQPMWGTYGATSQDFIQFILLILGVICIPLMLFPKPIVEICCKKKNHPEVSEQSLDHMPQPVPEEHLGNLESPDRMVPLSNNQPVSGPGPAVASPAVVPGSAPRVAPGVPPRAPPVQPMPVSKLNEVKGPRQEDSGQIFVHQLIETIEYVLGCISNTASYLRLWALSLAHSQLSQVFFQKTIESGISKGIAGIPLLILAFPILAGATFGVLLCMDSMECFLHTLRLHWVQFQNKFYKGDGFGFNPLNFQKRIVSSIGKS